MERNKTAQIFHVSYYFYSERLDKDIQIDWGKNYKVRGGMGVRADGMTELISLCKFM